MEQIFTPKYCDPKSILLVSPTGALKRLYCPFRVKCREPVINLQGGTVVWVEEVAATKDDKLVFWVLGVAHLSSNFEIKNVQ